jgi:enolase
MPYKLAQTNSYTSVMSHRSGETEDTTIADLAVGLSLWSDQNRLGIAKRQDCKIQSVVKN